MPIASPMMKTSVWSDRAPGEVRKKYASVMWNSEREVMIVFPEMSPILLNEGILKRKTKVGSCDLALCVDLSLTHKIKLVMLKFRSKGGQGSKIGFMFRRAGQGFSC